MSLPATPYELADVLDKVRITDECVITASEVIDCELEFLPQFVRSDTNFYELNHLAHRLSKLSAWELDCFEGMVIMDAVQTQYAPIPVDRLINMTHSTEHCQIAYEAHDDQSLGKFYADNDFMPELETLSERIFPWLDYGKIGKEMREGEGGVFTSHSASLTAETLIHSDQGSHYTSLSFTQLLKSSELRRSMSRRANCWDKAPQESFFGHMKDEIHIEECNTYEEILSEIINWTNYYNNERYQWDLAKLSPTEYSTGEYPLKIPKPNGFQES